QVFSFSSSSGTMNVAHGSSLNNDLVLHPYIVSESRELFFHLILQVAWRLFPASHLAFPKTLCYNVVAFRKSVQRG
ncbi:hypothetical protein, partial [Candidatus Darwinibacter acetoxidans]